MLSCSVSMPAARCRGKPSWHRIASKFLPGLEVAGLFVGIFLRSMKMPSASGKRRCLGFCFQPSAYELQINLPTASALAYSLIQLQRLWADDAVPPAAIIPHPPHAHHLQLYLSRLLPGFKPRLPRAFATLLFSDYHVASVPRSDFYDRRE